MDIYISTNMYVPMELENIFSLMEKLKDCDVGIELFVEWQDENFIKVIEKNMNKFKLYKSSLHGPYYSTEHSKKIGTKEYELSKKYFIKTLELSKKLNSKHIVYHHNNCKVTPGNRKDMLKHSTDNLIELTELAHKYGTDVVVENTGTVFNNNLLFNETQFIEMAKSIENNILIDIGHAFINRWDMHSVIKNLNNKITAYHLHNNYGTVDSHNRIKDGSLDIDKFFDLYEKYTPAADLIVEYGKNCNKDEEGIVEDIKNILELPSQL
ncbi:sugar phosphate isomerase/epimerase family protein [Clostridium oryzae]|uniref:Fructoselysine 3-epimerase n=1 Tax=Clostridium oryzae TaxID=1450648 RepID=A0A1V4IF64_9CLOT|nr:sugar phosphate isomerase/epimerase [Clostridium oryzae]OPJ58559.1 fructoselysine 3-epimerase [Clostridium oryzae]